MAVDAFWFFVFLEYFVFELFVIVFVLRRENKNFNKWSHVFGIISLFVV
jgi:hypothetical protein